MKIIQLELHTITELDHSRIMFVDMDGNVILDTQYNNMNEEVDENGILYTINNFDVSKLGTNHSMNGNSMVYLQKKMFPYLHLLQINLS